MAKRLPKQFLARLKTITAKRARTVIDHILKHGFITTEELQSKYGYDHPPRAIRDVREHGIPIETFKVKGAHGRTIAAYRFGDPSKIRGDEFAGRKVISKEFKRQLALTDGPRCAICSAKLDLRYLQVDHRVPYQVAAESGDRRKLNDYMLVCGSCNRAKSWSCEHCKNWLEDKKPATCLSCYWASPNQYEHISLAELRRIDVVWTGEEVQDHDRLRSSAQIARVPLPDFVKDVLRRAIKPSG